VYAIKRSGLGNVQWFKVRLVCGGNRQIQGIDYEAIYKHTACLLHVRLALTIAAKYDVEIHLLKGLMPFLGVDLEEQIYMHLAQG